MVSSDEAKSVNVTVPDTSNNNGDNGNYETSPKGTDASVAPVSSLAFHKSVSLINLSSAGKSAPRPKIRFSIDANALESVRSPILMEGDHIYTSGLRRIRQQAAPSLMSPTGGPPPSWSVPGTRVNSICLGSPTSAPSGLGNCENLAKFPSESLHSFSFAHQSEDFIHSRQNIIKRGIEFMRDKLGWAGANPHITSAQAKVQGDHEMVNVMEFLEKANLVGPERTPMITGPVTGPAKVTDDGNPFEKSFADEGGDASSSLHQDDRHGDASEHMFEEPGTMDPSESIVRSEATSRTATNESAATQLTSPPPTRKGSLKRTYTDTSPLTLQTKILEALAQPYIAGEESISKIPGSILSPQSAISGPLSAGTSVHNHSNRYAPASQAIFTTEKRYPWTILAANDLACLVFGVTKAEVRKIGILEVVKEERREWLASKLRPPPPSRPSSRSSSMQRVVTPRGSPRVSPTGSPQASPPRISPRASGFGLQRVVPANTPRRSNSEEVQTTYRPAAEAKPRVGRQNTTPNHEKNKSRGVILCGDVVPIQKRNGHVGAASLWVKEKKSGLIWVMEEIMEDVAYIYTDRATGRVVRSEGDMAAIFGDHAVQVGVDAAKLLPRVPRKEFGGLDYSKLSEITHYTASNGLGINIPCSVQLCEDHIRIASFPHIAGIIVLSAETLKVLSSNTVFATALFGREDPAGLHVNELIPQFDDLLKLLEEEDSISLVDGLVLPEHSFRRARAHLALREGKAKMAASFLKPSGLPALHRDGGELKVDIQMRVVTSESDAAVVDSDDSSDTDKSEVVYALWITYSRQLHVASLAPPDPASPLFKRVFHDEPPHQPSPGQSGTPVLSRADSGVTPTLASTQQPASLLRERLEKAIQDGMTETKEAIAKKVVPLPAVAAVVVPSQPEAESDVKVKKTIADFVILEDMGQGAYGQVKLARYKKQHTKRVILKYVTKKRILVDTWFRDRKLGTVPLEIHVLNFLRRDDLRHPNIVEMSDFFEDDTNYYIEMVPHGLPGMDLFDYIELKVNMDESECRNIFVQVVLAIQHLHTKALVVHRDIKDENVVLDGEGKIKLIDFGSAAYIKSGPFDVFVGTIDYAAPEVLGGKSYRGKEQDVWALGVLLYTICYKENPFYNIDEIMDRDLRIPYIVSEGSIDLIKSMLNRDVEKRLTITQVLEHPWCQAATTIFPAAAETAVAA